MTQTLNRVGFGIVAVLLSCIAVNSCQVSMRLEKAETGAKIALDGVLCQEKCPAYIAWDFDTKKSADNSSHDKCMAGCMAVSQEKIVQLMGGR